jgi:acetolactate synthase I/II/III large subunit
VKVIDAIASILRTEGAEFLSAYPTTPLIEAAAKADIRPVLCRQERVGVGIADGYARVKNGKMLAVFGMQYGPGAENAFPGVATAYSDSTPMLLLPLGHQRDRAQVFPLFSSARTYASVTKSVETITAGGQVVDVMRRAISLMRMGRPGPVMVEIPADVVNEEVPEALIDAYRAVKVTAAGANARDVESAARALREAHRLVIHAGQGVLYAGASDDLVELAELLQAPVVTTLEAKSAFPEDHPIALGSGGPVVTGPTLQYVREADVVLGIGCSFTRHGMAMSIPAGKTLIHATNDERDLNKSYAADYPLLGDARLVLRSSSRPSRVREAAPPGVRVCGPSSSACARPGSPNGRRSSARPRSRSRPIGSSPSSCGRWTRARPSSLTTRGVRATNCCRSTGRSRRAAISGGASRMRSAPGSVSSSGPSWPPPTSSASTSWATPPSA